MYKIVEFTNESNYIEDFINLSKSLYNKRYPLSLSETRQIVTGEHILSKYYQNYNFIVYEDTYATARCCLFVYDDDPVAYLGLYECIDSTACSSQLLEFVIEYAKNLGFKEIIGPVDSSFYVKYRLKISGFDKLSYFAEPYNKQYYYNQFLSVGFTIKYKYNTKTIEDLHSQSIRTVINKRYDLCVKKGYVFKTLHDVGYDNSINDLYHLFISTYDVLPIFKKIDFPEFNSLFIYFKYIVKPQQVQLVYYKDELVAFAIILPNYQHYFNNKLTFASFWKILKVRLFNNDYIGLYFGAKPGHYYTSKAILKSVYDKSKPNSIAIAALMKSDSGTTNHYKDNYQMHSEYVLMSKEIA